MLAYKRCLLFIFWNLERITKESLGLQLNDRIHGRVILIHFYILLSIPIVYITPNCQYKKSFMFLCFLNIVLGQLLVFCHQSGNPNESSRASSVYTYLPLTWIRRWRLCAQIPLEFKSLMWWSLNILCIIPSPQAKLHFNKPNKKYRCECCS